MKVSSKREKVILVMFTTISPKSDSFTVTSARHPYNTIFFFEFTDDNNYIKSIISFTFTRANCQNEIRVLRIFMSFIVKFYISPNYALILRPYLVCLVERGKNYITSEKVNKREEGNKRHFFTECNIKKRYIVYL